MLTRGDFETDEEAAAAVTAAATALQSINHHARAQATSIPSHTGKSSFLPVVKPSTPSRMRNSMEEGSNLAYSQMSASLREKNKKLKHNESESRRRTRIRQKFAELRVVSRSDKKDRYTVLVSAIERLRLYELRIQELEKHQEFNLIRSTSSTSLSSSRSSQSTLLSPTQPVSPTESTTSNGTTEGQSKPSSPSDGSPVESGHAPISVPKPINPIHKDPAMMHKLDDCLALKNVGLAMAYISLNGLFQDCNQTFCDLMGYPKKQLLETSMFALTHPHDLLVTFTMMKKLLCGELSTFEMDKKCVRSDGSFMTAHVTMSSVRLGGKPAFYLCFMTPSSTLSSASTGTFSSISTTATPSAPSSPQSSSVAPQSPTASPPSPTNTPTPTMLTSQLSQSLLLQQQQLVLSGGTPLTIQGLPQTPNNGTTPAQNLSVVPTQDSSGISETKFLLTYAPTTLSSSSSTISSTISSTTTSISPSSSSPSPDSKLLLVPNFSPVLSSENKTTPTAPFFAYGAQPHPGILEFPVSSSSSFLASSPGLPLTPTSSLQQLQFQQFQLQLQQQQIQQLAMQPPQPAVTIPTPQPATSTSTTKSTRRKRANTKSSGKTAKKPRSRRTSRTSEPKEPKMSEPKEPKLSEQSVAEPDGSPEKKPKSEGDE